MSALIHQYVASKRILRQDILVVAVSPAASQLLIWLPSFRSFLPAFPSLSYPVQICPTRCVYAFATGEGKWRNVGVLKEIGGVLIIILGCYISYLFQRWSFCIVQRLAHWCLNLLLWMESVDWYEFRIIGWYAKFQKSFHLLQTLVE